jgi:phosphoglycerate dehydrogenase-like enzyme
MSRPQQPTRVAVLCGADRPRGLSSMPDVAEVEYVDPRGLAEAVATAEVLLVWDFGSGALADAWPAARRLRWVHVAGAGVDRVLFPELVDSDVTVTNSRGVFERPMAEYVLALLLAWAKDLPGTLARQRERTWEHRETFSLRGRLAVVVGSGPIGREIQALLEAVGMRVRLLGRAESANLPAHVGDADFLVGVAPLTERTRGLFDRKVFEALPDRARFVNVGRGASVVEADLLRALDEGDLAGAALDVFAEEPLPADHPLWSQERVVVSPHMAADAVGWREALVEVFTDNLRRWRAGEPLRNVVDKERGYVPGS